MKERYRSKVAVFLILTKKDSTNNIEVLLQKRTNTGYMDGMYDPACGGHVEKNESLSMAVIREAHEEIGITINECDLKLIHIMHKYTEEYINVFFTAKKYVGIPKIVEVDKCNELRWFNINNLPKNIIPHVKKAIESMQNNIIYSDC